MKKNLLLSLLILAAVFLSGCAGSPKNTFTILSASENKEITPVLDQFSKKNGIKINMVYKGSVDIMHELEKDSASYDAVWPANSMWITMGDKNHKVRLQQSVMTSPVVFGVRKSVAQKLGFIGKQISVRNILDAIRDKKLTFTMTSATQSNSGASAYIGFLNALLGNPDVITAESLQDAGLQAQMRALLAGVNRSSGSSEWLKDLFLKGNYDAMVNYESVIISTNQELIRQNREPLYVLYPKDGIAIADSPLGYIDRGDAKKEEQFKKLQSYLLSADVQKELLQYGRRTGIGGAVSGADPKVFSPDWGIDVSKGLSPIRMPSADVIRQALNLYQTELRKPSLTVYCLDFSGSMSGDGESRVKQAMHLLLDQQQAKENFLQSSAGDVTVVIPFSDAVKDVWKVTGNSEAELKKLDEKVQGLDTGGGTDIYTPAIEGIDLIGREDLTRYSPAVILMTDGLSNTGRSFEDFRSHWEELGRDIPVFSITFGSASEDQLNDLSELTRAAVFDGKTDLVAAFKKAKGYN